MIFLNTVETEPITHASYTDFTNAFSQCFISILV